MGRPKKIRNFKVVTYRNKSGSVSYRVTGKNPDGSKVRRNFKDEYEAKQVLADLEAAREGHVEAPRVQRTRLTAQELADAESAILSAGGRSLSQIVSHYVHLEARADGKGISLDGALAFTETHYRAEIKATTVLNAYDEFINGRHTVSDRTRQHYSSSLKLLLKPDPNKPLHSYTVSDIEKLLARFKNVNSTRTYRQAFSVFFNWAVRHHYCPEDPCKRLDRLPKDMTQIAVLSLEEVKRLLYAAVRYEDGVAAAPTALGLFIGLRPSELADLKPEDISGKAVRVTGGKMRRKLKRTVPIPPVLEAWLKIHPFLGLPAGWDYKMKALKKATGATKWIQNIIRHTSISFQSERDKDEARTAFACGTSVQMMDRHYRNTIEDEKTLADFWNLTPERLLASQPDVRLPSQQSTAWPAKPSLETLIWQMPLIHAAADIGVSDVALRKHCVKLGIKLPPPGHWRRHPYLKESRPT
ncbi:hypothetical protein JIN84_17170 [Luteolibacter yonseiensis]|uniref:Core-binding (CB) domain-containing protein n=1 Tax=Luteolibacter yonseiensis TaxID=1144680 RepID=A0A934VCP2_9BACT|nr:hypothetical protein [Luteolibacter yonseiensis]MBK1817355.1 hypothetical protein [Luteolibacter yonseiensis]